MLFEVPGSNCYYRYRDKFIFCNATKYNFSNYFSVHVLLVLFLRQEKNSNFLLSKWLQLMPPIIDISKLETKPHFKRLQSAGLIDSIALRNLKVKSEYNQLRKSKTRTDAIYLLTEKYHLSYDSIWSILFRERKIKSVFQYLKYFKI